MAPPLLEGTTLGKRQKHYNKLLEQAVLRTQSSDLKEINIKDVDIDNLFKIDTANNNKNVEYILEVLKSQDTLYVSRAIKRCTWLITDPQYAHIVNPDYLHTQLFPQMTTKATNKLMLHIRLHLKDEARVEGFYNHYKCKDKNVALKWLPQCSLAFIEKEIENNKEDIELPIIKRLCERSISVLEILIIRKNLNNRTNVMRAAMFHIHTDAEKYFDILDTVGTYYQPAFGQKFTRLIMKLCPQRILNNFEKYCNSINLEIFAKHLKKGGANINAFLLKQFENELMDRRWFKYENLKHFMPKEFEFMEKVFIEKLQKVDIAKDNNISNVTELCSSAEVFSAILKSNNSANVYHWYRFAPFDVAFSELKKLIRVESSPVERIAILEVLVTCASRNMQHMHTLLQYYHDKHINEPFKFKIQFVNNLLLKTETHKFDKETWKILNNIFCSMEVYSESDNNVQICIQSIVVYKVLHGEKVPDVVEQKLSVDTLQSQRKKLNFKERDDIFTYLYNNLVTRIQQNVQTEAEFVDVLGLLQIVLNLLINWNKELLDYPLVINEIRKLAETKRLKNWTVDLSSLYNREKSWRKHLFEHSLILFPSEAVCINALKHDPNLLERYKSEVDALCRQDRVSLDRLLSKLRIYWPESLAREWTDWYLRRLDTPGGHKALVRGLCALLPQKQLIDIARKYAPTETKITWTEDDNTQLNLCIQFAKKMYLARPPPSLDMVLLYARGGYLQFAMPSLNAVLCNLTPERSREEIMKFLDAPVSLQKHGIRLAFTKLKSTELKQIISDIWRANKNSSIRAVLFTQTYDLLCREKQSAMIEEIWEVLSMFIDDLSANENKTIFQRLEFVARVPLVVRVDFLLKAYKYLKSLPAKANCEGIVTRILNYTREIMELLDDDFVSDILLGTPDKKFATHSYGYTNILSSYLLCTKDRKAQIQRYEKLLVPLLERCFDQWQLKIDGNYIYRATVRYILKQLCSDIQVYVFKKNMVIPVEMFGDILAKLERRLSIQNDYILLRTWKMTVAYIQLLEAQKIEMLSITESLSGSQTDNHHKWNEVEFKIAPELTDICIKYLKEDVEFYFSSICVLFSDALKNMFSNLYVSRVVQFEILKLMLSYKECVESYIVVIRNFPTYYCKDDETSKAFEMRRIICSHPSSEIRMHYYKKFTDCDINSEN